MAKQSKPTEHYGKWRIRILDAHGKRRSEVFDTHADAMRRLRELHQEKDEIRRGLRAPVEHDKGFDALCVYWLENRAIHKRSFRDDVSILKVHLRPFFGDVLLRSIGVERIDAYRAAKAALNPKTLANHLTLLKSMFNVAVDLGWLGRAPKIKKPRIAMFSTDFRYLRTTEEIDRFLHAASDEGEMVFALYATAVFTGLRAGELGGLHWDDIDFERRLITVQRSFDGPTKSGDVRYVPLLDALLPILRAWRLKHPGTMVFTNRDGNPLLPSGRVYQEVLHRVLLGGGFTPHGKARRAGGTECKPYITFHDLRHTFASHWVMNGGDIFKLQKILGHKSIAMTMRYAHLAPQAYREDWGRFASPSTGAVVVPLSGIG